MASRTDPSLSSDLVSLIALSVDDHFVIKLFATGLAADLTTDSIGTKNLD